MGREENMRVKVTKDGPYMVSGGVPLSDQIIVPDEDGVALTWDEGRKYPGKNAYALCRCGHSGSKPYCDGSHNDAHFDGTETASRRPFVEQTEPDIEGPELTLSDAPSLCAAAGFCDRAGGVWRNAEHSDDPEARKITIQETCDCPSGRLVIRDKKGTVIEPELEPSIGLVEDSAANVQGPIWVRGGIPVESADGYVHEIRNRVTLCRCGRSRNKPFCDGEHTEG